MRYPTLVSASPIEKVLDTLKSDILTLRRIAPEAAEERSLPISKLETAAPVWARSHDKYKEFREVSGYEPLPPALQLFREDAA
jgi:hypothetical protein